MKRSKTLCRKILSVFLAVVLTFLSAPLSGFVGFKFSEHLDMSINAKAVTSYTYNPDAAVEYAKAHYNDGKGLCAEFVSDCLKAGGFTAVYNTFARDLGRQLQEYGKTITCSGWSSSSCLKASMFNGELSKGDVIIWENKSGSESTGHAMLYSGKTNANGQVLVYAHNVPRNEEVIKPSSSATTVYAIHLAPDIGTIPGPVTNLKCDKKVYTTSESIKFTWDAVYGATEYWVYLWKDGVQLYQYNCGANTSFTQAPSSPGKYSLVIRPGNSYGYNDSSKWCSFIVTDKVPDPVTTLRCDKEVYDTNESIKFYWDEVYGATEYWVYLWKDGVQLYQLNCGTNTSFTQAPSSPGKYTLVIRPGNSIGFNDNSNTCKFVVGKYNINYNPNNGQNAPAEQTKAYGEEITLSLSEPTRDGYTFLGWSTDANAAEAEYLPGDTYSENADLTLYAVWEENTEEYFEIYGSLKTFGESADEVTVIFYKPGESEACGYTTLDAEAEEFCISGIEAGEYELVVSKENHVGRFYEVSTENGNVNLDIVLNLVGDMNGDGKVNTVDVARANAHAKGVTELSGYEFYCVDINGDGKVNTLDVARMNAHSRGITSLW